VDDEKVLDEVEELRKKLGEAHNFILTQDALLKRLSTPPIPYATVVATTARLSPEDVERKLQKPGTKVRVKKDSEFRDQVGNLVGSVIGPGKGDGWLSVRFKSGAANYRYGMGGRTCDLELANPLLADTAVVTMDGKLLEVAVPEGEKIEAGDCVTVVTETMQILDRAPIQSVNGDVVVVRRMLDDQYVEIEHEAGSKVVFKGRYETLEKGSRVILDRDMMVIVRDLGKDDNRFTFAETTGIVWDDIGGLEAEKAKMIEAVEMPYTHGDLFKFYNKKRVKGILLSGPSGCGKTMLGKATASALKRIYSELSVYEGEIDSGFMAVRGPEILDKYVGMAELAIRQLFDAAQKHQRETGFPAIIFIDEAESLLPIRGSGKSSDIEKTIVPQFLSAMDGLEESGALIILATNRPDLLDTAIVRDGRIDYKIRVTRPTPKSAADILRMNIEGTPLKDGCSHQQLADLGSTEVFADSRVLYKINTKSRGVLDFTLANLVNGSMMAGIADKAISSALRRNMEANTKEGVTPEDILAAVLETEMGSRDINHDDDLAAFIETFQEDVESVARAFTRH